MIDTTPLHVSLSNLADINHDERMNPIDFEGQGHNGHVWKKACEHNRD